MPRFGVARPTCSSAPAERLSRFATDPALILDIVSGELIPAQERDLVGLGKAEAAALVARIDRRKAAWGRLRDMLERIVSDGPASPIQEADERYPGADREGPIYHR